MMAAETDDASIITLLEGLVEDPYEREILKLILSDENNNKIVETMIKSKEGGSIA